MGACCCCASRGVDLNESPYHDQVASQEREPLSSAHHGTPSSTISPGLLVDTNLGTSIPDTYRPPPAPLPYDFNLRRPLTPSPTRETNVGEITNAINNSEMSAKDPKEATGNVISESELVSSEAVEFEDTDDLKKSNQPFVPVPEEEEDGCPICLEEYDDENPKLLTKCEHHFHLACILEWMERSDACPVCDKEVIIDPPLAS